MKQGDIDPGRTEGISSEERAELARVRRENRVQAVELKVPKRASPYFARRTCSQNGVSAGSGRAADGFDVAVT